MLRDVAGGVGFDEEVEVALVFVGRYRSIGAHDFFWLASDGGCEGDVLADREAEDVGRVRELESVASSLLDDQCESIDAKILTSQYYEIV